MAQPHRQIQISLPPPLKYHHPMRVRDIRSLLPVLFLRDNKSHVGPSPDNFSLSLFLTNSFYSLNLFVQSCLFRSSFNPPPPSFVSHGKRPFRNLSTILGNLFEKRKRARTKKYGFSRGSLIEIFRDPHFEDTSGVAHCEWGNVGEPFCTVRRSRIVDRSFFFLFFLQRF